jgi:hypothetical protein
MCVSSYHPVLSFLFSFFIFIIIRCKYRYGVTARNRRRRFSLPVPPFDVECRRMSPARQRERDSALPRIGTRSRPISATRRRVPIMHSRGRFRHQVGTGACELRPRASATFVRARALRCGGPDEHERIAATQDDPAHCAHSAHSAGRRREFTNVVADLAAGLCSAAIPARDSRSLRYQRRVPSGRNDSLSCVP